MEMAKIMVKIMDTIKINKEAVKIDMYKFQTNKHLLYYTSNNNQKALLIITQ